MMKTSLHTKLKNFNFPESLLNLKSMIILGSFVHIAATFGVYLIGKFAIFPNWISSEGILKGDAVWYLKRGKMLGKGISNGNLEFLFSYAEQVHLRIYTFFYFLLSDILGSNVLTFEVVNLPLFLSILFLIYKIGETLFDPKVGIIAAYMVMFLPTFVLHTTQPLRDTLFLAVFLLLLLQLLRLINKPLKPSQVVQSSLLFIITFTFLWFVRDTMFLVYLAIIFIAICLLLVKNFKSKWELKYNLIPISVLLVISFIVPLSLSSYLPFKSHQLRALDKKKLQVKKKPTPTKIKPKTKKTAVKKTNQKSILVLKVNSVRYGFSRSYKKAGSNIDADYYFEDTTGLLMYMPKAVAIGFFAPFPNTWFQSGAMYGKVGRFVAGGETFLMYFVILFAILALVKNINFSSLFISASIFTGVTALGLVVINVGAIYRLRYAFWFLLIVLGAKGFFVMKDIFDDRYGDYNSDLVEEKH